MTERLKFVKKINSELTGIDFIIPNLNRGGCGVFTSELAQNLRHYGYEVSVVSLGPKSIPELNRITADHLKSTNDFTLRELHNRGLGLWHFLTKWTDESGTTWYIDSEGVHTENEMVKKWHAFVELELTVDEMTDLSNQTDGWNTMFDRQFIPKLAKKIREKVYSAWYICRPSFADFTLASAR